ncbi:MAG: ompW family protein [Hyphomicrobiales bacterium]|nr:ompW family protein [Hyphomicrobiales bacterium]
MNAIYRATAALLLSSVALPALAADLPSMMAAPLAPAYAAPSPWMVRVRALAVLPQSSASVTAGGAYVVGGSLKASDSIVPELDISYFFTKNIAAELILGVTPHRVKGAGTLAGLGTIGSALLLPPTLLLQYHFTDFGAFKPYVGAGVNYTFMLDNKAKGPMSSFHVKDAPGLALQIGFDYMIDQHWGINFDVKKLWLRPDATATIAVGTVPVTAKFKLDPWLIGTGVTYRF